MEPIYENNSNSTRHSEKKVKWRHVSNSRMLNLWFFVFLDYISTIWINMLYIFYESKQGTLLGIFTSWKQIFFHWIWANYPQPKHSLTIKHSYDNKLDFNSNLKNCLSNSFCPLQDILEYYGWSRLQQTVYQNAL